MAAGWYAIGRWNYSVDNADVQYLGAGETETLVFLVKSEDETASQTVTITITPVNDAPLADGQSVTTAEVTAKAIALTGDDGDPEVVQTLTFAIVTP